MRAMLRGVVRAVTLSLAVLSLPHAASAQLPGDSVRARAPGLPWFYGRVVALEGPSLLLDQQGIVTPIPLAQLKRLDVRRRQDPGPVLAGSMLVGAGAFLLSHLMTPEAQRGLSTSTMLGLGAGLGLLSGVVVLAVQPYRWRAVIRR